ncbi:MAG: toll/interleukin-1 receptor domain-containing protein, partial [Cyanobacteria bacterium J06607_6]
VEIKRTAPHCQGQEFDSESILGALSIGLSELELVRKKTHFHTYYDHRKRLKVSVSCQYDGAPISVGFSSKYYGQ